MGKKHKLLTSYFLAELPGSPTRTHIMDHFGSKSPNSLNFLIIFSQNKY